MNRQMSNGWKNTATALFLGGPVLLSGCFFRVPTGTHSWHDVVGVRVDETTTTVFQKLMKKSTYVDEIAVMDADGGGRYSRFCKETYYIQNAKGGRINLKSLESFTHDPTIAAQWLLPPGLVTSNTLARMLAPGTSGGLMWTIMNDEHRTFTNLWCLAVNFSSYHRTDGPPRLRVYVFCRNYRVLRVKELPLCPPATASDLYPDFRLDSTRQQLTWKAPDGYITYNAVTDSTAPASQLPPERILPLNTSPSKIPWDAPDKANRK